MTTTRYDCIRPGKVWLDTKGERIQAHGGSIFVADDGLFVWYGENKERTLPGSGVWHWGVRAYTSTDLYNWQDRGLIIPPDLDDPSSPLHPAQGMDRPHIIYNACTRKYVCWIKVMSADPGVQETTILTADDLFGPYEIVRTGLRPLGMNAGDLDLVIDPDDARAYYYFEKVHTELICADLTDDYTNVTGMHTSHFAQTSPPWVREAPAYFRRRGRHHLITSGTTGYFPNPSEVASAPAYHGPWTVLGDLHPSDTSRTSFRSQISSVFRHPAKKDLYIALADRWLADLPATAPSMFDLMAAQAETDLAAAIRLAGSPVNGVPAHECTSTADYVWLPLRFDRDRPYIEWREDWRIEDFA